MKSAFPKTLATLAEQRKAYQEQIIAIQEFEILLEKLTTEPSVGIVNLPEWAKFEVHFQQSMPHQFSVTVVGRSLGKTYDRATELWYERNHKQLSNLGRADVFISNGNMLMVVSPDDAAKIVSNEKCSKFHPILFKYHDRLIEPVGKTVWLVNERLPGYHSNEPVILEDDQKEVAPA